jgi:large subunit ribosomal protein L29
MTKKTAEIRELPDEELLSRLESGKEELFNLRFQMATGQLDNPMRLKQVRHEIARILTTLRQRHVEAEVEQEVAKSEVAALERSRAAQASGELKGTSLAEAVTAVPADAEAMPMGAGPEFEPHGEDERRPRRRLRRRERKALRAEAEAEEAQAEAAAAEAEEAQAEEPAAPEKGQQR